MKKLKGIPQEFKQVYLRRVNINLLRLLLVEQEDTFTDLSVHMGGSSKICPTNQAHGMVVNGNLLVHPHRGVITELKCVAPY